MKFEVIVDVGSQTFEIEADNKEEAEKKAIEKFEALPIADRSEDYWVGDCRESQ